jgi:hypothetical protein
LYQLFFPVVKSFFFFLTCLFCFGESFLFISSGYKPELFIKLRGVIAIAADDLKNDFRQIPLHSKSVERCRPGRLINLVYFIESDIIQHMFVTVIQVRYKQTD